MTKEELKQITENNDKVLVKFGAELCFKLISYLF